jgi:hypothetical protein
MDLYSIAEVKKGCHAPLAAFNARFAEQLHHQQGSIDWTVHGLMTPIGTKLLFDQLVGASAVK